MKFTVLLDRDEDGIWIVECPAIPGCFSQGKTKEEALFNVKEAIQLCLDVRDERAFYARGLRLYAELHPHTSATPTNQP